MRLYAFMFMGNYDPEKHQAVFDKDNERTSIYTVRNFEEAKECVKKLFDEGYGALELCGAFSKEMADELAQLTNHEMAIGYMTHDPSMDPLFDSFFAG